MEMSMLMLPAIDCSSVFDTFSPFYPSMVATMLLLHITICCFVVETNKKLAT